MLSKNAIIVLSLLLGSFVILGLVVYLRQSGLAAGTFDKGQRFTAKPGTTRENAMILTSNKRPSTPEPGGAIARSGDEAEGGDPLQIKSLSPSEPDARRSGPAGDTAREALNSFSTEAGLQKLDAALALPNTPEQSALLHEAKGQLLAQLDPPDYDASLAHFDQAAAAAGDAELRAEIVHKTAQMLMQAGRDGEAAARVDAQLAAEPPQGPTGYKLRIIRGQLLERTGRLEEAESTYQAVLAAVQSMPEHLDPDAARTLARLAGLRLTGMYRKHDRQQAADALSAELKRQLAHMESPR